MIRTNIHSFIVLTFLLLTSSSFALEAHNYGPLNAYAQSPLQSNSLTPQLRSGYSLTESNVEFYANFTAASIWAHTDEYSIDYYQNQVNVGGKWQLDERWQIDLGYRLNYAGDNHLDGLTKSFHQLFGIDQNGRDEASSHQFSISIPQYDIDIEDFQSDTLSSATTLYLQYQWLNEQNHGLSLGGSIYYNHVNSGTFKGSDFEQAVQINYSYRNLSHQLFSTVGLAIHDTERIFTQLTHKQVTLSLILGYQYQIAPNHELHLEYRWYEGAIDTPKSFSEASNEFVLGYRYTMPQSALEISLTENLFNMDNSTDIAFTIGYRYHLSLH